MGKLLITDYSSVFFDFVYLNKPFIDSLFPEEKGLVVYQALSL
jgi:CDP-glycerol glycerophosphotransferase (TagB/SpsB family)